MPLENILSDLTAEIKALRLTIAAGMKAPAAFTVEAAAAAPAPINPAPIEAAAPTAEAAPAKTELPPAGDTVTARRSEQEKKAAEVEPGLQAKIEITQIYNDAREKGLTAPCGALIIETCKSLGFPRFSAVPVDRLPELVAAFSAAVTARLEG